MSNEPEETQTKFQKTLEEIVETIKKAKKISVIDLSLRIGKHWKTIENYIPYLSHYNIEYNGDYLFIVKKKTES